MSEASVRASGGEEECAPVLLSGLSLFCALPNLRLRLLLLGVIVVVMPRDQPVPFASHLVKGLPRRGFDKLLGAPLGMNRIVVVADWARLSSRNPNFCNRVGHGATQY